MVDEASDTELKIVHACFYDPYLLILRDDLSAIVLQLDGKGELDELERSEELVNTKWSAGSLHKPIASQSEIVLFLVSNEGALQVWLDICEGQIRIELIWASDSGLCSPQHLYPVVRCLRSQSFANGHILKFCTSEIKPPGRCSRDPCCASGTFE